MTERERLLEILADMPEAQKLTEMADYLLANGVIVLPIKVGDTVYRISEVMVPEYDVNDDPSYVIKTKVYESTLKRSDIAINGVYLTHEDAEKYAKLPTMARDLHRIPLKEE